MPNPSLRHSPASAGEIPGSPLKMSKQKRKANYTKERADACEKFATNPKRYRSLLEFVDSKRSQTDDEAWKPSKSQMQRDMTSIFGRDWASHRGGGDRGRAGSAKSGHDATGLIVPKDAIYMLEPSCTRTNLPSRMEKKVLDVLQQFEVKFGNTIITPVLIESIAMQPVLRQLASLDNAAQVKDLIQNEANEDVLDIVYRQLQTITNPAWMRSFLSRHKTRIKEKTNKRALEKHKASKHQPELVFAHLRNIYHAEALAQIQRSAATTDVMPNGFTRCHNIVQETNASSSNERKSLLEQRENQIYV